MPRSFEFQGQTFDFPDETSDDDALKFIGKASQAPEWGDVLKSVPGEVKRQLGETAAGMADIGADITGNADLRQQNKDVRAAIQSEREEETPKNMTLPQEGVQSGLVSAAMQAPTMAVGFAAGPAMAARLGIPLASKVMFGAGTTAAGVQQGVQKYGDMRDAEFGPARSSLQALFHGLVEKYTEYLPLKELAKAGPLTEHLYSFLGKEMLGEQLATLGQDLNDKLSTKPEMTLGDFLHDEAVTAIATAIQGPVQAGTIRAAQAAFTPFIKQDQLTPEQKNVLDKANEAAASAENPQAAPIIGALGQQQTTQNLQAAQADAMDLAKAASPQAPVAENATRLYAVLPADVTENAQQDHTTWTPDIAKVQQTLNVVGPNARVVSADVDNASLATSQNHASIADIRAKQNVADGDFVLPTDLAQQGTTIYSPQQPVSPSEAATSSLTPTPDAAIGDAPTIAVRTEPGAVAAPTTVPSSVPTTDNPAATNMIYNTDSGKVRLKFPSELDKQLFIFAQHSEPTQTAVGETQLTQERQSLAAALNISETEVLARANWYRNSITENINGLDKATVSPHAYSEAEYGTAQKQSEDPKTARFRSLARSAEVGKVTIAGDLPKTKHLVRMQSFLQQWVNVFTPGARIVISDATGAGESPSFRLVDGVSIIRVPGPDTSNMSAVFGLAHEFGHHMQMTVLSREEHDVANHELQLEWKRAKLQVEGMTAQQFVQFWMSPWKVVREGDVLARYGVKPTDSAALLIANIDSKMGDGYMLSFPEYLAEQFSRYVGKNYSTFSSDGVKRVMNAILGGVKDFFDKIVHKINPQVKFEQFVDNLRAVPATQEDVDVLRSRVLSEGVWFDTVDDTNALTTRVLERLPKKDKVLRQTIESELKRADVKDQERNLFHSVLLTFSGDVIDRTDLNARVKERLVPLNLKYSDKWANYGMSKVSENVADPRTIIFQLPFELSTANHFGDPKYFGHARDYNEDNGDVGVARHIVELQSDLAQKQGPSNQPPSVEELEKWYKNEQDRLTELQLAYENPHEKNELKEPYLKHTVRVSISGFGDEREDLEKRGLITPVSGWPSLIQDFDPQLDEFVKAKLANAIEQQKLEVEESRVRLQNAIERQSLNIPEKIETLPKRWWEFMLRALNKEYSTQGVVRARLATADTVALVEGWPAQNVIQEVVGKKVTIADPTSNLNGKEFVLNGQINPHQTFLGILGTVNGELYEFPPQMLPKELVAQIQKVVDEEKYSVNYGHAQGIYNRYAKDITNFVKREFGAKEVEVEGHTWLEWDVKPNLNGVGVEYYDLNENNKAAGLTTGEILEKGLEGDVPNLPAYFTRMQGFFQSTLQLNQIAKLLGDTIEPLQRYRRFMQSLSNLKNEMMSGPNDRIKEWYSLSKNDSVGVMQMLRDEVEGQQHWTQIEEHQVQLNGKVQTTYMHSSTPQLLEEAKKRNVSERGVQVYLGVKNDLLNALGQMEQTLTNSINEYFKNNPLAGAMRIAVAQKQFAQFRAVPYLPDARFGQWSVIVRAKTDTTRNGVAVKKGEIVWFSGHRRKWQQGREYDNIAKEYGNDFAVSKDYIEDQPYVLRSLPREFVNSIPEALGLDEQQLAKFNEMYYDATKEGSYLKLLGKGKKRTPGAEQDVRQQYANYMWRTANLVSKMAFGRSLQRAMFDVNALANNASKAGGDATPLRRLHEYLQKNYSYVMMPQHEWEQLRAVVSLWYLYGVPKTALMNLGTLPLATYPRLAAQIGDAKATALMVQATKDVSLYWKDPSKVSAETAALFAQAKGDGVTKQSFAAELAAVADGNAIERIMPQYAFLGDSGLRDRVRKYTWKLMHWGMVPFQVTEEFNRRVTLLAAYRAEKQLGGQGINESVGEGSAYQRARDTVDYTQNDYATWNRAPFLRGKKSVALIFFSFMQNMGFFMFGGDKGWWRGLIVLAGLSGLSGLPGAENLFDVLNWLGRTAFGKDFQVQIEAREMAQAIGLNPDFVLHGAMHNMFGLGWDTSSSIGMGRIIPGTDAVFGQGDAGNRVLQMAGEVGGPFGSLSISVLKALFDSNPDMLLRFDQALPPLVRNIERGYRGAVDDQWEDTKGNPLTDNARGVDVVGQVLGFTPTAKSEVSEERHFQREAAEYYTLRRQNLMSALAQATLAKDTDAILEARGAIRDYNAGVPAAQLRISAQEIQQSLSAHKKAEKEKLTGIPSAGRYRQVYADIDSAFSQ